MSIYIPEEIWFDVIFQYLNPHDMWKITLTCKFTRKYFDDNYTIFVYPHLKNYMFISKKKYNKHDCTRCWAVEKVDILPSDYINNIIHL